MSGEDDFFSVARTIPFVAFMPREVTPWLTALRAYSSGRVSRGVREGDDEGGSPICTSFPLNMEISGMEVFGGV